VTLDPTEEIKAIRDRLAAECDYDVDRILEQTRRHQRESGLIYLTSINESVASEESDSPSDREKAPRPTST
jgi:hypothetical protein